MTISAVIVDRREPDSIRAADWGVPTSVVELDCGDLWASTADGAMLVVERKAPGDLLNSIKDGRLLQQAAAIRQRSQWAYVVITGALAHTHDGRVIADNRTTQWHWDSVQGALLSVQEMGVAVVTCRGDAEYMAAVKRIADRPRAAEQVLEPRQAVRVMTPGEQVLTSLPGIGMERAQLLLDEWENRPAFALAWLTWTQTFVEIAGIGDGTKAAVRKALGLAPNEWITVFTPESAEYAVAVGQAERAAQPERVLA